LLLAWVGLAACARRASFAGHPLDCGLGFAHRDCAAGTPGYRAANAAREAAAARDSADAARCQSYGLKFGTAEYAQCRMNIDNERAATVRAGISAPNTHSESKPKLSAQRTAIFQAGGTTARRGAPHVGPCAAYMAPGRTVRTKRVNRQHSQDRGRASDRTVAPIDDERTELGTIGSRRRPFRN
jgi:hypothetical protein